MAAKHTQCKDCGAPISGEESWQLKGYHVCGDCKRTNTRRWYVVHHDRERQRHKIFRVAQRDRVLEAYGDKCVCCGEATKEFLAIDHTNGGGNKHRAQIGSRIFGWLIRMGFPSGFQILCHNCNCAKQFYGKCPHNK